MWQLRFDGIARVFVCVCVCVCLGAFVGLRYATVSFMSICPSALNDSASTGGIFMNFMVAPCINNIK